MEAAIDRPVHQVSVETPLAVSVSAPARLHFGLLNLSGLFGRVDGGTGIAVAQPRWEIDFSFGPHRLTGVPLADEHKRALQEAFADLADLTAKREVTVHIRQMIPSHVGLGSKTSLLLSAAAALARLTSQEFSATAFARRLGRGGTSGIGVHAFSQGGFIWDAGHAYPEEKHQFGPSSLQLASPPPLITTFAVEWLTVIHFRFESIGIHGKEESQIFSANCPLDHEDSLQLVGTVASELAPSLIEHREDRLQDGLRRIQSLGLKKLEWSYQSELTREFRDHWRRHHSQCALGLSSMGPTMFCLTSRPRETLEVIRSFPEAPIELVCGQIDNRGAVITTG